MTLFAVAITMTIQRNKRKEGVGIQYIGPPSNVIIITRHRGPIHLKFKFSRLIPDQTMHKSINADMLGEHLMGESH